eukprot:gnl/MRDRNA2_/MRDRNA2_119362_c0_seq1.p1 gnl/MRDRNA2_/MRDRNA2_119362_c0~~gnl/MRDRNA2_/MRDRNA2_119362_c0_seq1.p1  ORF type:complete len:317 (-),score=65.06 gnl/MRDRNA2_/MRDRNA2_119362_c0_seq1:5-955(-)
MQLIVWHCFFSEFLSVALSMHHQKPNGGSGTIVHPKLVIPGEWKVNKGDTLIFLPLDVPSDLQLERVKLMSNGESILVIVTKQPEEKPETNAVKKFRLILDALKQQAGYDEKLLMKHLEEWYETEDDDEVRVLVKSALDSVKAVRDAKKHGSGPPPTMSIPLGLLDGGSRKNSTAHLKAAEAPAAFLAGTAPHNPISDTILGNPISQVVLDQTLHKRLRIIKESFSLEIPYPVSVEQVFVLQTVDKDLMVTMPLKRTSLEARGISTGGKPFIPTPIYNLQGQLVGGPKEAPDLYSTVPNLSAEYFANPDALKPLEI